MAGVGVCSATPSCHISQCRLKSSTVVGGNPLPLLICQIRSDFPVALSTFSSHFRSIIQKKPWPSLIPKASVESAGHTIEPGTNVKFQKDLIVPGGSDLLGLLGTGYREKVFAIIGVKVYAAGFYAEHSITESLNAWKGRSSAEILADSSLFSSIFKAPTEKSLKIVLVRDVDGKTFWNALDDVISSRIKEPTAADNSALSIFRNTFQGRALKEGTSIFLTWVEPSKMLVTVSSDGFSSKVDAMIESMNVNSALFDAFLGDAPVSPTLKASVANGLSIVLK